ncbi:outer membrane beta-barrel protein [Olivibacter sp. SDN3]|uniref:outer membrane beta-barrel protein n=1 Tax=Olivibacter sp. SDN3 TaxID=2764720 RepID=UPI0016513478|nr:outer membrane beta-barrel protein [Olivibacter sp. SDN3]QNL50428.1 outer membrane beta-barrel protein [Olivibacter sp. SDN3]
MKHVLFTFLLGGILFSASYGEELNQEYGEELLADTTVMDTVVSEKKRKLNWNFSWNDVGDNPFGENEDGGTIRVQGKKPKVILGITFARFDLGLATLLDNGSFTLSPENNALFRNRTWKTINVGFDVFQFGYRFDEKFRLFMSAGFDWTHLRLQNNVIFERNTTPLTAVESDIDYSKNRFSSSYLRIPITFEHRIGPDRDLRVAYGPIGGFLLNGSQKFKSSEEGKRKVKDDFNYTKFRYGAFARVGYKWVGLYAKYYFNDMFENSPQQEGLKNLSFGVMFFF